MTDFEAHITRQIAFSRGTFGPGPRTKGVIDHIRKELVEIEQSDGSPEEWVDVVILALDGLWRSIDAEERSGGGEDILCLHSDYIAARAVYLVEHKQGENELREWPDWRTASPDEAIEHVRSAA